MASEERDQVNMSVLGKSRRPPEVGDVFAMLQSDGRFLFGRVIDTNANPLGVGGAILIYVYRVRSVGQVPVPRLRRDELLLPPIMTNRQAWTRGYFKCVESRPLEPTDRLDRHSFRDSNGRYFDERGNRLSGAIEPVGIWGLQSYHGIDDAISRALGIPLAAE